MTTTGTPPTTPSTPTTTEMVTVTIDGKTQQFPKGTVLLEACNQMGAGVPFFCYHPGLTSPAVCRQCLVDVKGQPKPVPSCYTPVADKMEVMTKSPRALDVRRQMLEFTLVNHPIDCPICDKAGECLLQKHYFDWDAKLARNDGIKVKKAKVVDIGPRIVLDQERCILCTRCIRVCDEVAKTHQLEMADRGDHEILTTAPGHKLDNPYSLNTVDVCPVGALTSKDFRFAMRAWELYTTPSICPGCATGCNVEVHHSRGKIQRLIPRQNDRVNEHWMCDEGRLTYKRVNPTLGNPERVPEPSRDGRRRAKLAASHAIDLRPGRAAFRRARRADRRLGRTGIFRSLRASGRGHGRRTESARPLHPSRRRARGGRSARSSRCAASRLFPLRHPAAHSVSATRTRGRAGRAGTAGSSDSSDLRRMVGLPRVAGGRLRAAGAAPSRRRLRGL